MWAHEYANGHAMTFPRTTGQGSGWERLADFESIKTRLDLQDIQTISATVADAELHHSLPLTCSGRSYALIVDSVARMFAPFLFDAQAEGRRELIKARPIFEELLMADACVEILTPFRHVQHDLARVLPGVDGKVRFAPSLVSADPFAGADHPVEGFRGDAPVLLLISKPPICDAFGALDDLSLFDSWCASLLGFAAFSAIQARRPDARLIWSCPDWRQDPTRNSGRDASVLAPIHEGVAGWPWKEELATKILEGSVTVSCARPNEQELRRMLGRADILLDFSAECDSALTLKAMQYGCIPVLLDTPEARELIGSASIPLVPVAQEALRRHEFGFREGFGNSPRSIAQMLDAVRNCTEPVLELIEAPSAAARVRIEAGAALVERSRNRDRSAFSNGPGRFLDNGATRLMAHRPLEAGDFSLWPMSVPEHQFDGIRMVAIGPSGHGRLLPDSGGTSVGEVPADLLTGRFDALINHFSAFEIFALEPTFHVGSPSDLPVSSVDFAEGSIDTIDDSPPAPTIEIGSLVAVAGWMAISIKEGILPDAVYVTLTDQDDQVAYIKTRRAVRTDVVQHFDQPKLRESGFVATFPSSHLPGNLTLGLARETGGRIELCRNFQVLLRRGGETGSSPRSGLPQAPMDQSRRGLRRTILSLFRRRTTSN